MAKRDEWGSRIGFIMAAVGSAIGLGNIWRFPYQVYSNGGGAFLFPYFFALFTAGIPLIILEFGIGHRFRGSAPSSFGRMTTQNGSLNNWEWLGWFQSFVSAAISTFYSVIISWTICYAIFAFYNGWGTDTSAFFYNEFLKLDTNNPLQFGGFNFFILGITAFVWFISWLILFKGIKNGIELANKIFMPTLIILMLILTFRSISLSGAEKGLDMMFKPNIEKLKDIKVWTAAYGQIFFTLSVGFAVMISYASYLPKKTDIVNNAFLTGLLNCGFSVIAGIMVFATLGSMAEIKGLPVNEVVAAGPGLAFVVIPEAISNMPLPFIFGPLFFISLTIAGLSSLISIIEAVAIAIIDKFNVSRKKVVTVICVVGFLLSAVFTTHSGLLALDIVDYFINNFGIIVAAILELILLSWFFKLDIIKNHVNPISDFKVGFIWKICLTLITPIVLLSMAISNFAANSLLSGKNYGGYSNKSILILGWGLMVGLIIVSFILQAIKGHDNHLNGNLKESDMEDK